jgi:hypothetical protein
VIVIVLEKEISFEVKCWGSNRQVQAELIGTDF